MSFVVILTHILKVLKLLQAKLHIIRQISLSLPSFLNTIWNYMTQEYARVSVEMPKNEDKKSLRQELTYEIENNDIKDEFTVKF